MEGGQRHGRPDEEMFLRPSSAEPDSPTVEPLRISKPTSPAATPSSASIAGIATGHRYSYSNPQNTPSDRASISAPRPSQLPYPDDPNATIESRTYIRPQQSSRPHFDAHDPHRPSVSWSAQSAVGPSGIQSSTPHPTSESPGQESGHGTSITSGKLPESLRRPSAPDENRTASESSMKATGGAPLPPVTPSTWGGSQAETATSGMGVSNTSSAALPQALNKPSSGQSQVQSTTDQESGRLSKTGNAASPPPPVAQGETSSRLEQDMHGLHVGEEAPPAYEVGESPQDNYPEDNYTESTHIHHEYPPEKGDYYAPAAAAGATVLVGAGAAAATIQQQAGSSSSGPPGHVSPQQVAGIVLNPEPGSTPTQLRQSGPPGQISPEQVSGIFLNSEPGSTPTQIQQETIPVSGSSPGPASATAPPPLPEGWIAHLDPKSGQYYYIHISTQSTQWEFPKGPTPLNLNDSATSPSSTRIGSPGSPGMVKPLVSPSIGSQFGDYTPNNMSGISQSLPLAGIETYKVKPTNGVYFGPYLRYTNMDVENGVWYGSILLITDSPQPPTIHIHQTVDLSPNPRQLKPNPIYKHRRWTFYRFDADLRMEEQDAKWTYAITSHLGCTRYEFRVAGRQEKSWRYIAHSGNEFALNVSANERTRLGGHGLMWKDILQQNQELGGFHAQLGMGNQIYADRLWKELPMLRQWTAMSGKDNRKNAVWTLQHEDEVSHAYFHYYTSHFDQDYIREAFAKIPHVLTLDDHDIFDGFGSYPEHMQFSNMFKNIGRIGIEMYLLFQHNTSLEILRNVNNDFDLFTITGTGWHFLKYLGPAVVAVAPDCRSERNPHQVMAGPTYQGIFPKVAVLPPSVQHCIWMIPVPVIYPRLKSAEQIANTMATGKRAVTGTFNALGKVTSSVAGVIGAKGVVGEGFNSVKKAVGKSGLMSNVLSPFGELDFFDELRDQWTHESKDLERTYLIRTLQGIAQRKSLRMTFLSGATNCCGAGIVHDPARPRDHKTMYQIVASSVVNAPPSSYVLRVLHTSGNKALYVPQNGQRSPPAAPSDTKEDMLEVFGTGVNGHPRELKRLMERRNYAIIVSFDPEMVPQALADPRASSMVRANKISLAVEFMVQDDASANPPAAAHNSITFKYGPVVIPSLEPGM